MCNYIITLPSGATVRIHRIEAIGRKTACGIARQLLGLSHLPHGVKITRA